MNNEFVPIKTPIEDSCFDEELTNTIGSFTHMTYKVYLMQDDVPVGISRLVGKDEKGVLTIGYGSIERVRNLVKSVRSKNGKGHHFGLKYHQAASSTSIAEYRLFMSVRLFMSSDEAFRCEGYEQYEYRQKHGENPPYSGRWEGGPE